MRVYAILHPLLSNCVPLFFIPPPPGSPPPGTASVCRALKGAPGTVSCRPAGPDNKGSGLEAPHPGYGWTQAHPLRQSGQWRPGGKPSYPRSG